MLKLFRHLKPFRFAVIASLAMVMLRALVDLYLTRLTADIVNIGVGNDIPYILCVGAIMLGIAVRWSLCRFRQLFFSPGCFRIWPRFAGKSFSHVENFSCMNLIFWHCFNYKNH